MNFYKMFLTKTLTYTCRNCGVSRSPLYDWPTCFSHDQSRDFVPRTQKQQSDMSGKILHQHNSESVNLVRILIAHFQVSYYKNKPKKLLYLFLITLFVLDINSLPLHTVKDQPRFFYEHIHLLLRTPSRIINILSVLEVKERTLRKLVQKLLWNGFTVNTGFAIWYH